MSDTDSAGGSAFADKLRLLFNSVRRPDGKPYGKAEVADATGVSRSYVYLLLAGQCEPGYSLVVKLARFFEVDLEYFADSPRALELTRQYELLAKLGEQQVHRLATRASELSPERLRTVLEFMDFQARQGEDDT